MYLREINQGVSRNWRKLNVHFVIDVVALVLWKWTSEQYYDGRNAV
jgi:hypothetical protein